MFRRSLVPSRRGGSITPTTNNADTMLALVQLVAFVLCDIFMCSSCVRVFFDVASLGGVCLIVWLIVKAWFPDLESDVCVCCCLDRWTPPCSTCLTRTREGSASARSGA